MLLVTPVLFQLQVNMNATKKKKKKNPPVMTAPDCFSHLLLISFTDLSEILIDWHLNSKAVAPYYNSLYSHT